MKYNFTVLKKSLSISGWLILLLHVIIPAASAQLPDKVFMPNIHTVQLYSYGNQLGYPVLRVNSGDRMELHFDDLDANIKNYSYTFVLCNADWTPAMLSPFDYIKGFSQIRISTYRTSSIALTRYTHYQAVLPDRNCIPSRSGNYLLKVFLNGDTSQLAFTRRFLVVNDKAVIAAQIQQPYNGQLFNTHQKVQFKLSLSESLDVVNALQQIKVVILQNNRWDNAVKDIRPTFFSRTTIEYNTENDCVFPAGKEWRWLDLRSLRLQSDRVAHVNYGNRSTEVFVKPDLDRSSQRFNFYRDVDGLYTIGNTESINPFWQSDYATVHFAYIPPGKEPYNDKEIYLFGALTNYNLEPANQMTFNDATGMYETTLFLKQGYYDYCYVTIDKKDPRRSASFADTEGNFWETENNYTILVYYRSLGGRADELVGIANVNSLTGRQGL